MTESQAPARSPVYEFDYVADPGVLADCHARYWELKETAPPVIWTNSHGGHWVCNTGAAVQHVVRHPEIFSSRYLSIPHNPNQPKMIPQMRSEEHTSELQSLMRISYAVFC